MAILTQQNLEDIVRGATLLGAGGGGPVWMGKKLIASLSRYSIELVSAADVPDSANMAVTSFGGIPDLLKKEKLNFGSITLAAFNELEWMQRKKFTHVLPLETGAGNTLIPMTVAARRKIPVVDVDGARRAVPSPVACTWAMLPLTHIVLSNKQNAKLVVDAPDTMTTLTTLTPAISSPLFLSGSALAMWAMNGAQMKQTAVQGSITYAMDTGCVIRSAVETRQDPVEAAVNFLKGKLLFTGKLKSFSPNTMELGSVVFQNDAQEMVTIYTKPDSMIAWSDKNAKPLAMIPDLICIMNAAGETFSNADFTSNMIGQEFSLIAAPAVPQLTQTPLLQVYLQTLNAMGYAGAYLPVGD